MRLRSTLFCVLAACTLGFFAGPASAQYHTYVSPTRTNQYGTQLGIWFNTNNGRQFCGEMGDGPMVGYLIGCGEDESTYLTFSGGQWIGQPSGSANQCYDIFGTIQCATADAAFTNPTRANQYGYQQEIWVSTTNGNRYCVERGYSSMSNWAVGCGEDESSYVTYSGGQWVSQSSGSANQCFDIFASISCD